MRTTLQNVIDDIKQYVKDNHVMSTCFSNSITDTNQDDIDYPLVFLRYGNVTTNRGQIEIDINILFTDILVEDESNYESVLSRMLLAALDFKTYFREVGGSETCTGWYIDQSSTIVPFKLDLFTDHTAGYEVQATVIIGDDADKDNVPNGI